MARVAAADGGRRRVVGRQREAVHDPRRPLVPPDGPNPLTSRAYARDLNEVKRIGELNSPYRTADQTMAAIFWQAQPLELYGGVLRDLSARFGLEDP